MSVFSRDADELDLAKNQYGLVELQASTRCSIRRHGQSGLGVHRWAVVWASLTRARVSGSSEKGLGAGWHHLPVAPTQVTWWSQQHICLPDFGAIYIRIQTLFKCGAISSKQ